MIDIEQEFWQIRKGKLEKEFAKAAVELMKHMNNANIVINIPQTEPPLYIALGEADAICSLLLAKKPEVPQ